MAIGSHSPFSFPFPLSLKTTSLSVSIDLPDLDTKISKILLNLDMGWEQGTASQALV